MNWFNSQILPLRHPYNCTCNDTIYSPQNPDRVTIFYNWLCAIRSFLLRQKSAQLYNTERSIEIPLALHFLEQLKQEPVLELGCVLPYYIFPPKNYHVIDLMDSHPACEKSDIRDLSEKNFRTNVIAISTLEHIGLSDYGISTEGCTASVVLTKIIKNCKNYFITFPLGVNNDLELFVFSNKTTLRPIFLKRTATNYDWETIEAEYLSNDDKKYGPNACANTVCILTNMTK